MKKNNKFSLFFVLLQGLFTLVTLIVIVISFFQSKIKIFLPFCFGITLLTLTFNNYRIYHKKSFTIIYLIFGILCILYGFIKLRG